MILVWGVATDPTTDAVVRALEREDSQVLLLDQRAVLSETGAQLALHFDDAGGELIARGARWELDAVDAVFLRPYATADVARQLRLGPAEQELAQAAAAESLLWSWADWTEALVVNRPSAASANNCKPLQLESILEAGFAVPETVVTNDPDVVEDFWRRHGAVVYKSVSGLRSVVRRLHAEDLERLGDLGTCPVQFQSYVPGTDHRVHTVGDDAAYAVRIVSPADDYRYAHRDGLGWTMHPALLPEAVTERCLSLAAAEGLLLSGIDLRRTPDGAWYCFEVNPSPAFDVFDVEGQVAEAVARVLSRAGPAVRRRAAEGRSGSPRRPTTD